MDNDEEQRLAAMHQSLPPAPGQPKKKRKRRGVRLSKAERLAKRAAHDTTTNAEPPLQAIARSCETPAGWDAAERVAAQADGDDATHLVAFLGCLARQSEPRFRTIAHYGRRARGARAARAAATLPKALAAEGRLEVACCVAAALGSLPEAVALAVSAVDAVSEVGAAKARHRSQLQEEDDDGDSDAEHDLHSVTVDGEPQHAPLAQLARALSRDAALAERLVAGPCLRANWSSPERRRALKAAATALRILRAGAAPRDGPALARALAARAAPATHDTAARDADVAARLTAAARTLDPSAACAPFGSSVTGLGDGRGDVDLCLLLPAPTAVDVKQVAELLRGPLNATRATAVKGARVPVARATVSGVRVDVVVNARRELCNTALLKALGARLPQLAPLCRAARAFARDRRFGGNKRRHLSHYAWTVLCVRVLQLRGELPALPCPALTALAASGTLMAAAAADAAAATDLDAAGVPVSEDADDALAGRFVDLLRLVAFSSQTDVVSVRGADAVLPHDANAKHRDRLRLQDPLEVSRDLGAVLTRRTSAQLRYACLETYVHLVAEGSEDADAPRPGRAFPFVESAGE